MLPVWLQIDNLLNSKAVTERVPAIQDSDSIKAMCATFKRRPKGWSNSDCKMVTFTSLMQLTVKVIR